MLKQNSSRIGRDISKNNLESQNIAVYCNKGSKLFLSISQPILIGYSFNMAHFLKVSKQLPFPTSVNRLTDPKLQKFGYSGDSVLAGSSTGGTTQILIFKTLRMIGRPALYTHNNPEQENGDSCPERDPRAVRAVAGRGGIGRGGAVVGTRRSMGKRWVACKVGNDD